MEKILIIMGGMRLVGRDHLRGQIEENPVLGFDYDGLHYAPVKGVSFKMYRDELRDLGDDEVRLVEAYIDAFRFRVWLLGKDGLPYAKVFVDEALGPYAHCLPPELPENYWYNPKSAQWDVIYGVNQAGEYIGNVPLIQCAFVANCRPSFEYERWNDAEQVWIDARSLDEVKSDAKALMRVTANGARSSGVLFRGTVWASSSDDFEALASCGFDVASWPDADGDIVSLDGFTTSDLLSVMRAYFDECEARYVAACAAIDASLTPEAVFAVGF
jgi:hypothetical protein